MIIMKKIKNLFNKISLNKFINMFKESKNFKFVGLIIIVVILIITIIGINIDIAPENSVTVYVVDQNGRGINGLEIGIYKEEDMGKTHTIKYTKRMTKNRVVEVVSGDYVLMFDNIPKGYTCFTVRDTFSMKKGEKKVLEYECLKSK